MGSSWRKYHDHFEPDATVLGGDIFTQQLLKELYFTTEDVDALYTAFHDMDADNTGVIRLDELISYFRIKKTHLTEKLFEDKESKFPSFLNFEQFVVYTWQFLSLSLEKVASFAFHLMDSKKTGSLSQENVKYLIELMHNKNIEESKAIQKLVKKCGVQYGEKLSMTDFESFSSSNRLLCDPFRKMQISFQSKLLGRVIWKRIRLRRESASEGTQVIDDVADTLLAKFRLERRLNTSLIELDKRTVELEAKMEEMMDEPAQSDDVMTKREIHLESEDLNSGRIVLPIEGKVRVPKSASLHRKPMLIPKTEPLKRKKKKKRTFGRKHTMSYGKDASKRRHSMNDAAPALKDINNVEIIKSSSLDIYDDDNDDTSIDRNGEGSIEFSNSIKTSKVKEGSVLPF